MPSNSDTIEPSSLRWYQQISVEPTMFLYMFAFQLTSVIEQAFFVRRACMVNHNYSAAICDNLSNFTDIQKEVKVSLENYSELLLIKNIISAVLFSIQLISFVDNSGKFSSME